MNMKEEFINILGEIEGYLVDRNYGECFDFVMQLKKEMLGENKETASSNEYGFRTKKV